MVFRLFSNFKDTLNITAPRKKEKKSDEAVVCIGYRQTTESFNSFATSSRTKLNGRPPKNIPQNSSRTKDPMPNPPSTVTPAKPSVPQSPTSTAEAIKRTNHNPLSRHESSNLYSENEINEIQESKIKEVGGSRINEVEEIDIKHVKQIEIKDIEESDIEDIEESEINDIEENEIKNVEEIEIKEVVNTEKPKLKSILKSSYDDSFIDFAPSPEKDDIDINQRHESREEFDDEALNAIYDYVTTKRNGPSTATGDEADERASTLIFMTGNHDDNLENMRRNESSDWEEVKNKPNRINSYTDYSDQAASIFFGGEDPQPEQRVRKFAIKNEEDRISQSSA